MSATPAWPFGDFITRARYGALCEVERNVFAYEASKLLSDLEAQFAAHPEWRAFPARGTIQRAEPASRPTVRAAATVPTGWRVIEGRRPA
jgi:hypothetical protein